MILENQAELGLSNDQFTEIRAAVVAVQGNVAEVALLAENQAKKHQMMMLIRLKNLLTAEQIAYLESKQGKNQ